MGFNQHDIRRDACQLYGRQALQGYDWWWHSFTARHEQTGEERAFFFEFFLCNPALGGDTPILGQQPENQREGRRPSYLMVKCGSWGHDAAQLHRFYGWNEVKVAMGTPFAVEADGCRLSENASYGMVTVDPSEAQTHPEWMCQGGTMRWDLQIRKQVAFNVGYGASSLFRRLQLFEMFWHAEGMKTAYEGIVEWNGERYRVNPNNCYGYADKNWGKNFTSPWVWLSSNHLESELTGRELKNSVFDIGGGRPKVAFVPLKRKLLSAFWYEGKGYEFNFSKFWTLCRTRFDCHETESEIRWHVDQRTLRHRMVTDVVCPKSEMLLVNYESPDGKKRHNRLWNGGTGHGTISLYTCGKLVDRIKATHIGCEYGEYC